MGTVLEMDYSEALNYLDGFTNFERTLPGRSVRTAIKLDRVIVLAARLGNPQEKFLSLHVAGTKGKGSTCAFAESILSAAGYKCGLYVSPHLQDVRERISISGELIPQDDFARLLSAAMPVLEEMRIAPQGERRPTYFEILTHLAFAWFAERKVDVAVVEVGLGGRLDATNILRPVACAITSISHDHVQILGDNLEQIASEKAGILKPNTPAVISPQTIEVLTTIKTQAMRVGATIEIVGQDIKVAPRPADTIDPDDWPHPACSLRLRDGTEYDACLGLRGNHQVENWAVAVRLVDIFHQHKTGTHISREAVEAGSRQVRWAGRLEEITALLRPLSLGVRKKSARLTPGQASPIENGPRVFLDGAHNEYSLRIILDELRVNLPERTPRVVLFGCAKDKDSGAMLRVLARSGDLHVIFTHSGNARGKSPEELSSEWTRESGCATVSYSSCAAGLDAACRIAGENGIVLVAGSLYLVGAIKDMYSR